MQSNVWLVTGATGGVGQALARFLALRGASLILTARSLENLKVLAEQLRKLGAPEVATLTVDAEHLSQTERLAQEVKDELARRGKPLSGVVHAGGIFAWKPSLTEDGFDRALQINALFPALLNLNLQEELKNAKILLVAGAWVTLKGVREPAAAVREALSQGKPLATFAGAGLAAWLKMLHAAQLAQAGFQAWTFHPGFLRTHLTKTAPWPIRFLGACANWFLSSWSRTGEYLIQTEAPPPSGSLVEGQRAVWQKAWDRELSQQMGANRLEVPAPGHYHRLAESFL